MVIGIELYTCGLCMIMVMFFFSEDRRIKILILVNSIFQPRVTYLLVKVVLNLQREREVLEEIGIKITLNSLKFIGTIAKSSILNNGTFFNNEFDDVYVVHTKNDINAFSMTDGEAEELFYLGWRELKQWVKDKREDLILHEEEYKLLFEYLEKYFSEIK